MTISKRLASNDQMTAKDLKDWMNKYGISKHEFAEILGVTIQAVNLWLKSEREFSVTNSRLINIFIKYPHILKEF